MSEAGVVGRRARSGAGKAGFHAPHLARHFGLSSAPEAIPAGKVVPLVSDLAHSEPTTLPILGNLNHFPLPNLGLPQKNTTFALPHYALVVEW